MFRNQKLKWISCFLSLCMVLTMTPTSIVLAQDEAGTKIDGSKLQMWIGDTQVCGADSVTTGDIKEFNGNQLYKIFSGTEYDIYAKVNNDKVAEGLYIQPTCTDGVLDLPGIRIQGCGEVVLLCSVEAGVAQSEQITVNLNTYSGTDKAWDGYAVYSEFLSEENGGGRSDKVKFSFDDGAIHTDEATGAVFGSSVNVNGTIKTTGFSSTDVVTVNFGSEEKPLDYALEFMYQQQFQEWDVDSYYEIELLKAKTNAYINKSFVKDGSYLSGPDTVPNCYKSLWLYNDADLTITDMSKDNDSEKIMGNFETMRVMTGGKITVVGEESTVNPITVPAHVKASYYSSLGTYKTIVQDGERIQNFVDTVNCVVDSEAEGYNADTNPTPHKDTEGRYTYAKSNSQVSLVSTSKSLSIIGIAQDLDHGHFQVESCSGVMNEKGDFWAEEGTPVTFTLVPDSGYQYKPGTFCSNGYPVGDNNLLFKKTEDPGVYIYTMGPNACSITCEFEQAKDEMDVKSETVGEASIDMGENALNGTMEFSVSDATNLSDDVKTDIEDKAGEYEVGSVLDLSLDQKINTVTGEDAWKTNITELQHDMSISLTLEEELADGEGYEIIRVHDGVTEVVEGKYDADADTLTFDTDRFSIYAIAYKKAAHTHEGTKVDPVKATTTANGVKAYYTCSCGKYFEDAAATKEITDLDAWKKGAGQIAAAKNIRLSVSAYTYDGKVKNPAVTVKDSNGTTIAASNYTVTYGTGRKNVGKYTVKVTFNQDYAGTVTRTFVIHPKGTSLSSVAKKSKGFTVTWKKNKTQTTGYEIQYSTTSTFKNAKVVPVSKNGTTKKTISKLKAKKKYYVRIRTYKKIGSLSYYSSWSKSKTVKTK